MTPCDSTDELKQLVLRNDANATRIWIEHAAEAGMDGALKVPLYRCFSPRPQAQPGFHQLTAPLLLIGINPSAPCHHPGRLAAGAVPLDR
jgi:hypothetical protein